MITAASLKHPKMQDKIVSALIDAQTIATENGHGKAYIANAKGHNIMRLDVFAAGNNPRFPAGGVIVYGRESRQITETVETALGQKFCDLI